MIKNIFTMEEFRDDELQKIYQTVFYAAGSFQ